MNENKFPKINVTRSSMPDFDEYCAEIRDLWDSRWLTNMGAKHRKLEEELKNYLEAKNLLLFTNGHLALEAILRAMDLKGEVITTPFTFPSTTNAIVRCGLRPVFCDIKESDCTIDPEEIEKLITPDTCAILPVHVYGNICDNDALERIAKKHNLKLIYDAAHAFGVFHKDTPVSQMGDASMYSLHATKVFHTIEGGAVTFRDEALKARLLQEKNFGYGGEDLVLSIGGNAKMNEFQAAMGLCNLRHIEDNHTQRERVIRKYLEELKDIEGLRCWEPISGYESNYSYFPIAIDPERFGATRDDVRNALAAENINARRYFYPAINEIPSFRDYRSGPTPIAHKMSHNVLTLPMYTELSNEDISRIARIIISVKNSNK